jgi:phage repressor protein
MYSAQTTKNRIKAICKSKKISMDEMLQACDLGVNAIRQINDTKGMASFSLAKIADYLNCSIDYLVGRTDVPEINSREFKEKKIDDLIERLIKDGELTEDESVKVIDALK